METNNQNNQTKESAAQTGAVDYASALRQYNGYSHGRSMKKFCEDEGYDYWKFCKLAREGQSEMAGKIGSSVRPGFIEVSPDAVHPVPLVEEPMKVCEIRIRFNNGLILSRRGGDVEEVISAIRKILN